MTALRKKTDRNKLFLTTFSHTGVFSSPREGESLPI